MKKYIETLKAHIEQHPPNCGGADSVLGMLYECHNENSPYDNDQIRADFNELYQQMNGMPLQEMDKIIYPVCTLCRDHEKAGFKELEEFLHTLPLDDNNAVFNLCCRLCSACECKAFRDGILYGAHLISEIKSEYISP